MPEFEVKENRCKLNRKGIGGTRRVEGGGVRGREDEGVRGSKCS